MGLCPSDIYFNPRAALPNGNTLTVTAVMRRRGFSRPRAPKAPFSLRQCRFAARDRLKPAPNAFLLTRWAKLHVL